MSAQQQQHTRCLHSSYGLCKPCSLCSIFKLSDYYYDCSHCAAVLARVMACRLASSSKHDANAASCSAAL
eukprot:7235-Heterococcus_DN1.PRE.1